MKKQKKKKLIVRGQVFLMEKKVAMKSRKERKRLSHLVIKQRREIRRQLLNKMRKRMEILRIKKKKRKLEKLEDQKGTKNES